MDGARPAASSLANAVFLPRKAKIVKTSRPPAVRWADAPWITRSRISQPSTPPLSAAATGSSRARPGGVGIRGGGVQVGSHPPPPPGGQEQPRVVTFQEPSGSRGEGLP